MDARELESATGHQPLPGARDLDANPRAVPIRGISLEKIDKAWDASSAKCLSKKWQLVDRTGSVRHSLLRRISIVRVGLEMNAALNVRGNLQCQFNRLKQDLGCKPSMFAPVPTDQQTYRNLNRELVQFEACEARILGLRRGFPEGRCIYHRVGKERFMLWFG